MADSQSRLIHLSKHRWRAEQLLPRDSTGCSPWGPEGRTRLSDFTFTFHFHALENEMATHSSVLAWRIPGKAEPGGLPSMGSHRVGHDWSDLAAAAAQVVNWACFTDSLPSNPSCLPLNHTPCLNSTFFFFCHATYLN